MVRCLFISFQLIVNFTVSQRHAACSTRPMVSIASRWCPCMHRMQFAITDMEMISRPVLHIEARVRSDGDNFIIRTDIVSWDSTLELVIQVIT